MNKDIQAYYIYGLIDPFTKEIRYIGRTRSLKTRYKGHISKSKRGNTHRDCWIRSLPDKPEMVVLEKLYCSLEQAYEAEKSIIHYYISMGFDLTNHHDKGLGNKNREITTDQRSKISKTLKSKYDTKLISKQGCKKVYIYNLKGEFIKSVESQTEASLFIGKSVKHVQAYFKRGDIKIGEYILKRSFTPTVEPWKYIKRSIPTVKIKAVCGNDIKIFSSIKEVYKFFNLKYPSGKLYYYIDQDRMFNKWKLTQMPD